MRPPVALTAALYRVGLLALGLAACLAPAPWGDGAPPLPDATRFPIERHLDVAGLARASEALRAAAPELLAAGLPLAGDPAARLRFDASSLPVTSVAFSRDPDGLVLSLEIPPILLPWRADAALQRAPSGCDSGSLMLGPGRFSLPLAFASDELGRLRPRLAPVARWEGPVEADVADGCEAVDPAALASELGRLLPAAVDLSLGPELVPALGFDLPAALARDPRLAIHLRARALDPVTPVEGGVSAWFELALAATAAPCVAPLARPAEVAEGAAYPGPAGTGVSLPAAALEALLGAITTAGHLCGPLPAIPSLPGSDVARLAPAWSAAFRGVPPEVTAAWAPAALPTLTAASEGPPVRLALANLELSLWGRWEGARWQLAAMTLAVEARLGLALSTSGQLTFVLEDLAVSVPVARSGLLPPPPMPEARALAEAALGGVLDGLPLVALPASLAPREPGEARATGLRLTLPTR